MPITAELIMTEQPGLDEHEMFNPSRTLKSVIRSGSQNATASTRAGRIFRDRQVKVWDYDRLRSCNVRQPFIRGACGKRTGRVLDRSARERA
jgi:hypothetical protein